MSDDSVVPVLIVGAGPAGLVVALTLRKNGIPVRIIEKTPRVQVGQRGAGIMPRSQEVFNLLGVLVRKVLVYNDSDGTPPVVTLGGADLSVVDRYGHAHGSYQVRWNEFVVVIVRPDGAIGGIMGSTEGVKKYFDGIFSALSDS